MKNRKDKLEERKQANVEDGDTRPDKPEVPDNNKNTPGKQQTLTKERGADVNTIEDARDAK